MNLHQTILSNLQKVRGSYPDVAESTGISYSTLKKIANKSIASPRYVHLEKLDKYFQNNPVN